KVEKPLNLITQLRGCVNSDATTLENTASMDLLSSGKAAMTVSYPNLIPDFEKGLGSKLGISAVPKMGNGPISNRPVANSIQNWVIPKGGHNQAQAFGYLKLATDVIGGAQEANFLGAPTSNRLAFKHIKDPIVRKMTALGVNPGMPFLDS